MTHRRKWIEERIQRWFIHGASSDGRLVDIDDTDGGVFVSMPKEMADRVIAIRDRFVDELGDALTADDGLHMPFVKARA